MAKRYSVASPSTGTGGAKVLFAGGGRVGGGGIPKAAPGGFSIDLNLDKMRQKGEDDEKRKYLIEGGLDPKAVALMDTQSLDMGVRAMSDDLIEAEKAKGETEFSEELAEFIKGSKSIPTGREAGDIMPTPVEEDVPFDPENFENPEAMAEAEEFWGGIGGTATPDYGTMSSQGELLERFMGLSPRAATEPRAISAFETAKKRLTPKDGADVLARSYNLTITKKDGTKYNQRYTAMGEKIGKEIPLGPEDYKAIDGYLDGVPTTFFRNDETGEWKLDKDGNPKAHPWPKGFDKKAPKDSNDLNIKFSAFLEANEQYWNLLPWRKDKTKGVIAFDPVKWFMTGTDEQREAVVDFKNTSRDATVAILNAMTKLIKARSNQGKGTGAVNPEALKKALDNKRRGQ